MYNRVKIWDPLVRVFHWGTVGLFVALFFTGEGRESDLHATLGYLLLALLLVRIIWGFISHGHARFSHFVKGPRETLDYMKSILAGSPRPYPGHNPAGAAMVIALMSALLGLIVSGLFMEAGIEFEGPLSFLGTRLSDTDMHLIREIHETLVVLTLSLVSLHIAGVILASWQHGENLVLAMMTGYKHIPEGGTIHATDTPVSARSDERSADWRRNARIR